MTEQQQLIKAINSLDLILDALETAMPDTAVKEAKFKERYAEELGRSSGSNQEQQKADAQSACNTEYLEFVEAQAIERFLKLKLETVRSTVSALQTIISAESRVHFGTAKHRA